MERVMKNRTRKIKKLYDCGKLKPQNVLKIFRSSVVFRKIISSITLISLLWSNCVWAQGPLRIIEDDINAPVGRVYGGQKLGVIDPGAVSEGAVHNIFDSFQLPAGSGVVFKNDVEAKAKAIFNRCYSKSPIHLSGVIQSESPLPMVFSNPGGLNLENPEFKNIPALTIAAGGIAHTDQGLAYGIDQGALSLHKTVLEREGDLKSLTLAGRTIQLSQSILAPSERVDLTAGQHIGGLKEALEHPTAYVAETADPSILNHSILLDPVTILRAKNLGFRSFDEGVPICALGLLESTHEDIHIQAKGDIYLHHLIAARNLTIETTGRVFLGDQAWVGGTVNIKAKDIHIDKGLSSIGKAFLKASRILNVQGNLSSEEGMLLKGKEGLNLNGTIAVKGELKAKSKGDVRQDGLVYTAGALMVEGNSFLKKGKILSEGQLSISTIGDIDNKEGSIGSLSASTLLSEKGEIINRGDITSEEGITFHASKAFNSGVVAAQGKLNTMKNFFNEAQGRIHAHSISEPLALLARNYGLIKLKDDVTIQTDAATLRGTINTQGSLKASGKGLTIEGRVTAQQGAHFDLKSLTNKGTLNVLGAGIQGNVDLFTNDGKADFLNFNARLKSTKNLEKGVMRTRGHFVLQGDDYENKGKVFTAGVHQVSLTGTYEDSGTFYSPTLFLLNAKNVNYRLGHKSFLRDTVVRASADLVAREKAELHMENARDKSFLQLSSQGTLSYNGLIKQTSARFPLFEYYKIFGEESPFLYEDLADSFYCLPQGAWSSLKPKESGVVLTASKVLSCQGSHIDPESGSVSLVTDGQLNTEKAKIKAGYFKGNNALAQGKRAFLNETTLQSLFGKTSILVEKDLHLKNSHILGGNVVEVKAESLKMNGSSVKSSQGKADIQINKKAAISHSTVHGQSSATFSSQKLSASDIKIASQGSSTIRTEKSAKMKVMTLSGKNTILDIGTNLDLSLASLEGEFNKINAHHIKADNLKSRGITAAQATKNFKLNGLNAQGTFISEAEKMTLRGQNKGENLAFEASHLKNESDVYAQNNLKMKAKKLEQFGTTTSDKNSKLEATEEYIDTKTSRNEANNLSLNAEKNKGFNGFQKADVLEVKLQDMNLINLLNQTEARVTQAYLKEAEIKVDEDLVLKTNLHLWAKRLENKAKITGNDFIAHMETSILNYGSMDFHGKAFLKAEQSITNLGDVSANKGLGFETEGTFIHKGKADTEGFLSVKAKKIDADAEVQTYYETASINAHTTISTRKARFVIPSFSGKNIRLESATTLNARGAKLTAQEDIDLIAKEDVYLDAIAYGEGDQEITLNLSPDFRITATTDPRNKYLQGSMMAGGNIRAKTAGKLDGRGLQANAGGSIVLQADQGVDLSSLAAVSVVERWNYNTGVLGQNNHRGFREGAEFYRTELKSQGGGIYVLAKDGGITARGTAFHAQEEIRLDARDNVDVGTLKATERYVSHDEDQFLCFGSQDDKEGSTERFRQMQALSNKKIGIFSRNGSIEGDAPFMRAPEIELDGEKGIVFKPLEIHSQEDTHHYENNLNLNPTNIEFEHKEKHTQTKSMQQVASTLQTDKLSVRTGAGAKTLLTADISGLTQETTDIVADTDELVFSGIKSTYDSTTDSWSVKVSIDVDMMPGGGFDIAHDRIGKTNYGATVQKFGTFHNKRKGARLLVQGGAQTSINETTGEDIEAVVDHNAQDREEQEGFSFGVSASSTGGSAHVSAKGGEKISQDNLTGLHITKQTNKVTRKDIEHETKDTRWGFGVGVSIDSNGKVGANAQVQVGDKKIGLDVPTNLDKLNPVDSLKSMDFPKNLESLHKLTQGAANFNKTLNGLGVDTGDLGKGINVANQATFVGLQAQDSFQKAESISNANSIDQVFDKAHDTVSQLNTTAQTAGINTGQFGDFLQTTHSIKSSARNAKGFGRAVAEKFEKPPVVPVQEQKVDISRVQDQDFSPTLAEVSEEDSSEEEDSPAKVQEQPSKKQVKKKIPQKKSTPTNATETKEPSPLFDSKEQFVANEIARRKKRYQSEGKVWKQEDENHTRQEAEDYIKRIEADVPLSDPDIDPIDLLTGGVNIGRKLIVNGVKSTAKYVATKILETATEKLKDELVTQAAEALEIDPKLAQTYSQVATTVIHIAKPEVAKKSTVKNNSNVRPKDKKLIATVQSEHAPKKSHSQVYEERYTPQRNIENPKNGHVDKIDRYKEQLLERPGKDKRKETSLQGARTELNGGQTKAAILQGRDFDHVKKVENVQRGLLNRIEAVNSSLSQDALSDKHRETLERDFKKASSLLDYSEGFVPRTKEIK